MGDLRLEAIDMAAIEHVLREALDAAAAETLPRFRTALAVENKLATGFDPVTEADRAAERAIRGIIARRFPDHLVVGEEFAQTGSGPFSWLIDPVDGTRAFIFGVPVWGTLIAFAVEGHAVAGAMGQPFTGETFLGLPSGSSYHRLGVEVPLRTSGRTALNSARLTTTTPALFDRAGLRRNFDAVEARCLQARYGLDCYGYCLLAAGHIDLVIEVGLQPYDIAALIPIIRGAGGVVGTIGGDRPDDGGSIIAAATAELFAEALSVFEAP